MAPPPRTLIVSASIPPRIGAESFCQPALTASAGAIRGVARTLTPTIGNYGGGESWAHHHSPAFQRLHEPATASEFLMASLGLGSGAPR